MDNRFEVKQKLAVRCNVPGEWMPHSVSSEKEAVHVSVRYTWMDRGKWCLAGGGWEGFFCVCVCIYVCFTAVKLTFFLIPLL